jgi:CheY-like chemotaxis protein
MQDVIPASRTSILLGTWSLSGLPRVTGKDLCISQEKLVLIVDDQESDQHLLTLALRRLGVVNLIHKVTDGHEAIRYLNGDAPYGDRGTHPFPAIVFLDLHLPVVSGAEVLEWIKGVSLKGDSHISSIAKLEM